MTIKNNTGRALDDSASWQDVTGVDPWWQFHVHDSAGKPLARRVYNRLAAGFGKAIFRQAEPGKSITDNVDLGRLFDFHRPGKFTVQVSREIPKENGGGIVKSNAITITITPAEPASRPQEPPSDKNRQK